MPKPPLIGITSYHRDGEPPSFSLPDGYVDAVRLAGGTPVILPPGENEPARLLDIVDGLILAGGGDIDPAAYDGTPHETVYMVSEERDRYELDLARKALERRDLPAFYICRGMQVLNVATGGTLHVHVPERFGDGVPHRLPPRVPTRHAVRVDPPSRLAALLGATEVDVSSWHHQGIDRIGAGLQPVAWAADGVIEAVEHVVHPWCIGVQWHPEMQLSEEAQVRLFRGFVRESQKARKERQKSKGKSQKAKV